MKTKFLGLAVVFVALAVLVNVLAISSASIDSDMQIVVENTSTAMIALAAPVAPATKDDDVTVDTSSGVLDITLSDGLQPGSTYTFKSVFSITNNSANAVDVNIDTTGEPAGMTVAFYNASGDGLIDGVTSVSVAAASSVNVYMVITNTSATAIAAHDLVVTVSAANPTNP